MIMVCQTVGLYDKGDFDDDIQLYEQYSTFPPNWDVNSWMFYHSSKNPEDMHYIFYYLVKMQVAYFGTSNSKVLLGEIGKGSYEGNTGWINLIEDLIICRSLGINEVILYDFNFFLNAFGVTGFATLANLIRNGTKTMNPIIFSAKFPKVIDSFAQFAIDALFNIGNPFICISLLMIPLIYTTLVIRRKINKNLKNNH